jgi:PDZ domain
VIATSREDGARGGRASRGVGDLPASTRQRHRVRPGRRPRRPGWPAPVCARARRRPCSASLTGTRRRRPAGDGRRPPTAPGRRRGLPRRPGRPWRRCSANHRGGVPSRDVTGLTMKLSSRRSATLPERRAASRWVPASATRRGSCARTVTSERRLLSALDPSQREQLSALLRELLLAFEGSACAAGLPRLGLTLFPAHTTIRMRGQVGLPEVAGLMVRHVDRGTPAGEAGIVPGDVLVRAGGRPLRSIAPLNAALQECRSAQRLDIDLLRGVDELATRVDLPVRDVPQASSSRALNLEGTHEV